MAPHKQQHIYSTNVYICCYIYVVNIYVVAIFTLVLYIYVVTIYMLLLYIYWYYIYVVAIYMLFIYICCYYYMLLLGIYILLLLYMLCCYHRIARISRGDKIFMDDQICSDSRGWVRSKLHPPCMRRTMASSFEVKAVEQGFTWWYKSIWDAQVGYNTMLSSSLSNHSLPFRSVLYILAMND